MIRIHAVCSPDQRAALDKALEALGEGWDKGCWVPHSSAATPANPTPTPERYLLSAELPDDQAARLVQILEAGGASWGRGLSCEERTGKVAPDGARVSAREVITAHAAKGGQ